MLEAGVIREVQFSEWLSNPVLIKKANGKWRMCIDFTALNKACPRDPFPLPHIDQLVNSTAGCELLSFLDAYSSYHQVWLHPEDEAKTSFVTPDGVYCYVRMPFGLRNAGATFTRLIHSALEAQLGRNVEAYIDDVVIKSKLALDHAADLREMFDNLRRACIKLNPKKCTFGATRGKLLGYLVSKRGIEANPEKIKAITDMGSPRTPKEVHRLTGRLASLSRFLARSAENCLPFFAVLRGASPFRWTPECQQALDNLKTHLSKLTSLASPPHPGQGLLLYLAASPAAVSAVLVLKDSSGSRLQQRLVYYVSEALAGPKTRYTELEKMAYLLVMASRKLRHYFLAHDITVPTSYLLGDMLRNREAMTSVETAPAQPSEVNLRSSTKKINK